MEIVRNMLFFSVLASFPVAFLGYFLGNEEGHFAQRTASHHFEFQIASPSPISLENSIIYLSRPIPQGYGSFYWRSPEHISGMGSVMPSDMPGVGARSRFRVCSGGMMICRRTDGSLDTLIDGNNPQAPYHIVDITHFDISFDGKHVVFSGIEQGNYPSLTYDTLNPSLGYAQSPGKWRLYTMRTDGSELQQLTFSDQDSLDYSQFDGPYGNNAIFKKYDDIDPCWLPDGRIVFASTRWPAFAQYSGVRTTNLFVVNSDGSDLHRITSERNSAERPIVDPRTGKIIFARWWRNFRYPYHGMETTSNTESVPPGLDEGYDTHEGLTHRRSLIAGEQEGTLPRDNMFRNSWQAHEVRPDGTELAMYSGFRRSEPANHFYGGCFTDDGQLIGNFFPMFNMTEAAGFGGIRAYPRGPGRYEPLIGVTNISTNRADDFVIPSGGNTSYGIYKSDYAGEPSPLEDDRLLISWVPNNERRILQDYGLYIYDLESGELEPLIDHEGRTELLAKAIRSRPLPPILEDNIDAGASLLPPQALGPYDQDGTFIFDARNVYFNAPVDVDIISAPKVGEASSIRFYTDFQRHNPGSFGNLDWPILLDELEVDDYGAVRHQDLPANVQLFEQLRTSKAQGYRVPFTGGPFPDGAGHVAGLNYGRPGEISTCVGCHAGHSMIPIPSTREETIFTNLAPGAKVTVSSAFDATRMGSVVDRKVQKEDLRRIWTTEEGKVKDQWVQLNFKVPIWVREVRLYNSKKEPGLLDVQVHGAQVDLFSDSMATDLVGHGELDHDLSVSGDAVIFDDKMVRSIRIWLDSVSGRHYHREVAALGEIEVIASSGLPNLSSFDRLTTKGDLLSISPNPFWDHIVIEWKEEVRSSLLLKVFDLSGKPVLEKDLPFQGGADNRVGVPLDHLKSGVYLLTVHDIRGQKLEFSKLVKK